MSTAAPRRQRRWRKVAMSDAELDAFLGAERTCRLASTAPDGPHVMPLWFLWHGGKVWITSLVRSQRWVDVDRDPKVALVVDAGEAFEELRGVEIRGRAVAVGEAPRAGEPGHPELDEVEPLYAAKYLAGEPFAHDGRHAWLRIDPELIVSWDFRKS
jgi:hypothetical protein